MKKKSVKAAFKPNKTKPKNRSLVETVMKFCASWKKQDWIMMLPATQPSWAAHQRDPRRALQNLFVNLNLLDYSIDESTKRVPDGLEETGAIYEICVMVKLLSTGGVAPFWRELRFNVIRETKDGRPDADGGQWGVNPPSVLRGIAEEVNA